MTALHDVVTVLRAAEDSGVFTAVAAEIGHGAGVIWTYAAGRLGVEDSTPVDHATIFDLASLTKVIATASIALQLVRRGTEWFDTQVSTVIPDWTLEDRSTLTLRDLAEHCSGLPAHRDYFTVLAGIDAYLSAIAREPLEYVPRTRAVYSDLGFITLGAALERLAGAPLDAQFNHWKDTAVIVEPLTYSPPPAWRSRTAATGYDAWRGRMLQGEVHDQNTAALGRVAAHAGLFGTSAAVGAAARWWLQQFTTSEGRRFAARSSAPGSSRAIGWDTMRPTSSCGTLMSPGAVGHTGYTGTSLWIDIPRALYFVLLTNRVHVATSDAIARVRREFHDAANRALS